MQTLRNGAKVANSSLTKLGGVSETIRVRRNNLLTRDIDKPSELYMAFDRDGDGNWDFEEFLELSK